MLALELNLLTNKLQRQTLDEGQTNPNIKLINPDSTYKLSQSAQATLSGSASSSKKVWTVALSKTAGQKTNQQQRGGDYASSLSSTSTTKVFCCHKKPQHLCPTCGELGVVGTSVSPTVRALKRHSRSMSVPQETEINIPPAKSTWQPQGTGIWKPVPVSNCVRNSHIVNFSREIDFTRNFTRTSIEPRGVVEFSSIASLQQRHLDTGHITPEHFLTPPESPIPRPSSAVYSDGAISPLGAPWLEYCNPQYFNKHDVFRNRSLSLEDKISSVPSSGGSVVSMPGSINSMPSSPLHRNRIPRCRSQPSFYHDRKSGRRRRRDCRPTLNFHKMTETAYGHKGRSDPISTPSNDQRVGSKFHSELETVMSLMPIASSPSDTEAVLPQSGNNNNRSSSPIHELEHHRRDDIGTLTEEDGCFGPVRLLGEEDESEMEVCQMQEELDLEQIENH